MGQSIYAEAIAQFLDVVRDAGRALPIEQETIEFTENQIQDILHTLELESHNGVEMMQLTKALKTIRGERRKAKNAHWLAAPVAEWAHANKGAINSLKQLLGEIRKIEEKQARPRYYQRTSVVSDTLGKEVPPCITSGTGSELKNT